MPRANDFGVRGLHRDKSGQLWIDLRWRDPRSGERHRYRERLPKGLPMAAARERARKMLDGALKGEFDPKRAAPKKLREALDSYLRWLETERPKSVRDRGFHATALVASLGDVPIDALTALMVERFKKERREAKLAPATVNRHLATLKHFARQAGAWGWMKPEVASAIRAVRLLREPPGRVRYLSEDEEVTVFAALPSELRALALGAVLSGMRRSEIVLLRWPSVDLVHRSITLVATKSNRVRRIPINDPFAALLSELPRSRPEGWVFPLPTRSADSKGILRSEEARRRDYVSRTFKRAVGIKDLRFHDLRHDFATRLRRGGSGIDVIAKLLGHSTLAMAVRYAHLDDPALREAVRSMAAPATKPLAPVVSLAARRSE